MDLSLGGALVGNPLVFAQMEREAIGERTRGDWTHQKEWVSLWEGAVWGSGRFLRQTIHG